MSRDPSLCASSLIPESQQIAEQSAPVVSALQNLVAAWEVLPNGNYSPRCIEDWLARDMKPAVDAARAALASAREVQP